MKRTLQSDAGPSTSKKCAPVQSSLTNYFTFGQENTPLESSPSLLTTTSDLPVDEETANNSIERNNSSNNSANLISYY